MRLSSGKREFKYVMDTKPISLWLSCLLIILIIMVNIFMLLILTVIKVLTGPVIYHHSSYENINDVNFYLYIYLSHQACGRRKPDPSFCHSQHNPIKEVFFMWWVCPLTQRASFTAHWWTTPSLLHEGIWNIGCFWLADSLIYLRRPHAFIWFTLWYISESAAFAWSIKSLLFSCEAASPISISTACLRKTFLRIQPHDIFFRMFTSNKSLTSEYCKQA